MPTQKNEPKAEITQKTVVSAKELAVVLGLSVRRIQQMAQDGIITSIERGKYPLAESVKIYIDSIKKETTDEEDEKLKKAKLKSEVAIKASKARIAKLEADEIEGKMHRSDDVRDMTEDLIYSIRASLLSLPGRLSVDVASLTSPAECSVAIKKAVHDIMNDLSNYRYDPEKYAERVRERKKWEILQDDVDDE